MLVSYRGLAFKSYATSRIRLMEQAFRSLCGSWKCARRRNLQRHSWLLLSKPPSIFFPSPCIILGYLEYSVYLCPVVAVYLGMQPFRNALTYY